MKDYGTLANQRDSYKAKEELLSSRFEQVAPMEFYRDLFPVGSLQKSTALEDGLGNAIFRFRPDKFTYKKMVARLRGDFVDEIWRDANELQQWFARTFEAIPADCEEELNKRLDRLDSKFNAGKYRKPGQPIEMNCKFDQRVHDDLSELGEAIGKREAYMSPISYYGRKANSKNARYLHAIVIDIDGVGVDQLRYLIGGTVDTDFYMCCPTYIVNSGHGVHLYYLLEEPIPCYKNLRAPITRLKTGIARMVWNKKTSSIRNHIDAQPWGQMYRVVGSLSKLGSGYPATVYRTGKPVDIMCFNDYIHKEYRIQPLDSYRPTGTSGHDLEYWKEHNPSWYNRKILGKNVPRQSKWQKNYDNLYKTLLPRVRLEAKVGNRYNSMCVLFADAAFSSFEYKDVLAECKSMIDFLNRDVDDEKDMFTEDDVLCAAKYFNQSFGHWMTLERIELMTGMRFERNKRNGRSQEDHLKMARYVRDEINGKKDTWRDGNGRPKGSKNKVNKAEQAVLAYLQDHPDAKKAEVVRATGLSKPTVYKWYDKIKAENQPPSEA